MSNKGMKTAYRGVALIMFLGSVMLLGALLAKHQIFGTAIVGTVMLGVGGFLLVILEAIRASTHTKTRGLNYFALHAGLEGYEGPFFPDEVKHVQNARQKLGHVNTLELVEIAKKIGIYTGFNSAPKTTDGYVGHCSLYFNWDGAIFQVHFPNASPNSKGIYEPDRAIAVYTIDGNETQMNYILALLVGYMDLEYAERFRNSD